MTRMIPVEICLDSDDKQCLADNVANVFQAGAARIELCGAMAEDGLTPDIEAVAIARNAFGKRRGLIVMIRPRGGDFVYNSDEVTLMLKQIAQVAHAGADGVVFGALTSEQTLDLPNLSRLIKTSQQLNLQVGIHRSFDVIDDRKLAITQLIALGVNRVLTSGTPWGSSLNAQFGVNTLLDMALQANQKIEIVIAGGISAGNAKEILSQLSHIPSLFSLHAYSSVLANNHIVSKRVASLVNINL